MPLRNYGVLRGSVLDHRPAADPDAHLHVHVVDAARVHWRIAVNVRSKLEPSVLEYVIDSDLRHPILAQAAGLPSGWSPLARKPGGAALDYIRGSLFDREALRRLPFDLPGPDNDLNEKLAHYLRRATADRRATLFAFGERWKTQPAADPVFGFKPAKGVHDIHMNQANDARFADDDGVYQDGALLLHFPSPEQWVAIFLKFQSQTWHSDDVTGRRIERPPGPPDGSVRIVAALVAAGSSRQTPSVTLLNTTAAAIALAGWQLADGDGHTQQLTGTIAAGATLRVRLAPPVTLPDGGGTLSLLDAGGLKVDGAAYTPAQAEEPGRTIVF